MYASGIFGWYFFLKSSVKYLIVLYFLVQIHLSIESFISVKKKKIGAVIFGEFSSSTKKVNISNFPKWPDMQ